MMVISETLVSGKLDIAFSFCILHMHLLHNTFQSLPLYEGNMTVCSPEARNIAQGWNITCRRWIYRHVTLTQGQQMFYYTEKKCNLQNNWTLISSQTISLSLFSFSQTVFLNAAGLQKMNKMTMWSLQLAYASSQSDQSLWLPKDPNQILFARKAKSLISLRWMSRIYLSYLSSRSLLGTCLWDQFCLRCSLLQRVWMGESRIL